eukprot:TRINITY_DN3326_c0_g1_i2.p1 TRINITY_DN3326_c0_g1~~TRINITY_DN3326_c0_g1_i2.p1  ORF type:complete len:233 (+),score=72.81 TRINITY_DN3326_c0_g1_i2:203-901(+)
MAENYKIVVLGTGGVGKSAVTLRLCSGKFPKKHDPTIEDSYRKRIEVDGKVCTLDILDTAGQAEYRGMHEDYMREGRGFIIMYSIDVHSSFEAVDEFKDQVDQVCSRAECKVPIVLVGNKCDLDHARSVTLKQGEHKAEDWKKGKGKDSCLGDIEFFEASAKDDINVSKIFETMVRRMNKEAGVQPPKKSADKSEDGDDNDATSPHDEDKDTDDKPDTRDDNKGGGCKCSIQ